MSVVASAEERTVPTRAAQRMTPAAAFRRARVVLWPTLGRARLYTLQQRGDHPKPSVDGLPPTAAIGVFSLIFVALVHHDSVSTASSLMRADNHGGSGILALCARRRERVRPWPRPCRYGLFGAALIFYGMASSHRQFRVLSALEGVSVCDPMRSSPTSRRVAVAILASAFLPFRAAGRRASARFSDRLDAAVVRLSSRARTAGCASSAVLAAADPRNCHGGAPSCVHKRLGVVCRSRGVFLGNHRGARRSTPNMGTSAENPS